MPFILNMPLKTIFKFASHVLHIKMLLLIFAYVKLWYYILDSGYWVWNGWNMKLTTHLHLLLRLGKELYHNGIVLMCFTQRGQVKFPLLTFSMIS